MKTNAAIRKNAVLFLIGAGAAALANAQTSVQITGLIDVYAGSLQRSGDAKATVLNSNGMSTSYWGFKGVEDLGDGLKAQFNLTGFLRPSVGAAGRSNTDPLFARDANVGLSGRFGKISMGRDLAPNFVPSISLNPFNGISPFAPLIAHTIIPAGGYGNQRWAPVVAGDTGWSNEIVYTTPDINGATANIFYQLGGLADNAGKNNVGANVMYKAGAVTLGAYYQRVQINNPVDSSTGPSQVFKFQPYNSVTGAVYNLTPAMRQNTWFIGGAYDFNVVKLYATYQKSSHVLPPGADSDHFDLKSSTAQIGASIPYGGGQFLVSAARTEIKADANYAALFGSNDWTSHVKRESISVGYDYFLSKRTDLYAAFMHDKITDSSGANSFGIGMRHRF
jgi:predicted porin